MTQSFCACLRPFKQIRLHFLSAAKFQLLSNIAGRFLFVGIIAIAIPSYVVLHKAIKWGPCVPKK